MFYNALNFIKLYKTYSIFIEYFHNFINFAIDGENMPVAH